MCRYDYILLCYACSKAGGYSIADILGWAAQLAEALEVLSREKIYHGDLRSPNILLSPADHIIIADFGVCTHTSHSNLTRPA